MSSRLSVNLPVTLTVTALLLASCDSDGGGAVQQEPSLNEFAEAQTLNGKIDRTFAGEAAPELSFKAPDGSILELKDLKGTPYLINLWATWCAPCVVEMPMLDNLAGQMGDDLRVLTVSQDLRGADLVKPFFERSNFSRLEPWLDPENRLSEAYSQAGVLPVTVLFDADGKEVFRVQGGYHWDSEEAIAEITQAIAAP